MSLKEAFKHTKNARKIINPNLSFLEQLAKYEQKCLGHTITKMVSYTLDGVTLQLPDFIVEEYIDDYRHEFDQVNNIDLFTELNTNEAY